MWTIAIIVMFAFAVLVGVTLQGLDARLQYRIKERGYEAAEDSEKDEL